MVQSPSSWSSSGLTGYLPALPVLMLFKILHHCQRCQVGIFSYPEAIALIAKQAPHSQALLVCRKVTIPWQVFVVHKYHAVPE
jgi:hypothetical protein